MINRNVNGNVLREKSGFRFFLSFESARCAADFGTQEHYLSWTDIINTVMFLRVCYHNSFFTFIIGCSHKPLQHKYHYDVHSQDVHHMM